MAAANGFDQCFSNDLPRLIAIEIGRVLYSKMMMGIGLRLESEAIHEALGRYCWAILIGQEAALTRDEGNIVLPPGILHLYHDVLRSLPVSVTHTLVSPLGHSQPVAYHAMHSGALPSAADISPTIEAVSEMLSWADKELSETGRSPMGFCGASFMDKAIQHHGNPEGVVTTKQYKEIVQHRFKTKLLTLLLPLRLAVGSENNQRMFLIFDTLFRESNLFAKAVFVGWSGHARAEKHKFEDGGVGLSFQDGSIFSHTCPQPRQQAAIDLINVAFKNLISAHTKILAKCQKNSNFVGDSIDSTNCDLAIRIIAQRGTLEQLDFLLRLSPFKPNACGASGKTALAVLRGPSNAHPDPAYARKLALLTDKGFSIESLVAAGSPTTVLELSSTGSGCGVSSDLDPAP